ncbi:hypothetical protein EIP86_008008 [Pleurotus ostreatoroseus]|nr:hypothetical protein EIP86_008008 [Pleurotus ostreatoroseus]
MAGAGGRLTQRRGTGRTDGRRLHALAPALRPRPAHALAQRRPWMLRSLASLARHLRPPLQPSSLSLPQRLPLRPLRPTATSPAPRLIAARLISRRAADIEQQHFRQQKRKARRREERAERLAMERAKKKPRGFAHDSPLTRISKTMSYLLRHGAKDHNLQLRPDGFARVDELLALPVMAGVDFETLERIVEKDRKNRYTLQFGPDLSLHGAPDVWWVRANQGHSLKMVTDLELRTIQSIDDIPSKTAVHGTSLEAWEHIKTQGLSKMRRNHIHLAQGMPGAAVISGMRTSSQIFIYINVRKALSAGLKFHLSSNGVVLSEGNAAGLLAPRFFEKVVRADGLPVDDWAPVHEDEADVRAADPIVEPAAAPDTREREGGGEGEGEGAGDAPRAEAGTAAASRAPTAQAGSSTSSTYGAHADVHEVEKRTRTLVL